MASTSSSASTNQGEKLKWQPEQFPTYQSHLSSFGPSSSTSSAPDHKYKYDVFISFRGEDTRNSFTGHLHRDLSANGISVFKDDEELDRGTQISPGLLQAIQESRFSMVVFSKNYATSSWCLDELVHILECSMKPGKSIIPIFYDVHPTVVRHQSETFEPAFAEHEKKYLPNKVDKWRFGLRQVANISGWHLNNGSEVELIQKIVQDVSCQLTGAFEGATGDISNQFQLDGTDSGVDDEFKRKVGIDSRVKKLFSLLDTSVKDVRFIGIWGMAGIGKTTIAKVIYDKIYGQYEVFCFLSNVRESKRYGLAQRQDLVALQQILLGRLLKLKNKRINDLRHGIQLIKDCFRSKKCLLILDDVDDLKQLDALAGEAECFGVGSRIIITTRDAYLLNSKGVDNTYACEGLNSAEAMQLLSLYAFEKKQPLDGYEMMCKRILEYASGNPLILKVLGSSLCAKSSQEWESILYSLNEIPNPHITEVLRSSYESLDDYKLKNMFLYIACFFNRKKVDRVLEVLDSCGFHAKIGMAILIDKSLVTISNNILCMPKWVQQMGWEIVRQEYPHEPGEWSRLWHHEVINEVMTKNLGTDKIEAMVLDQPELECNWNYRAFENMRKLRLLSIHCKVHLPKGLEYLPDNLRFLKWWGYPLKDFPGNLYPSKLVELNMCHAQIELLWTGEKCFMPKLKFINLSHSQNLIKTPNFTRVPNLERLVLEGCRNLAEVHPSIGTLAKLRLLNLKDCSSLGSLPDFISMESLEICVLSGCSRLENFPNVVGNMPNLSQFYMDGIGTSIENMPNLVFQPDGDHPSNIRKCNNLECILSNILNVTKLSLRNCDLPEGAIPSEIGCLTSLQVLDVGRNKFISLPESIGLLTKLKFLGLAYCNLLQTMLELPSNIEYVEARDCSSLLTFSYAFKERTSTDLVLSFINCYNLKHNQDLKILMVTLLKAYLQSLVKIHNQEVSHNLSGRFDIVIPGIIVPEWFRHQNMGPSVRIQLPQKWCNNNWIGFVFCVVFDVHGDIPVVKDHDHLKAKNSQEISQEITCQLYTNEGPISTGFGFNISKGTLIESSHLWIHYIPNGSFGERMAAKWNRTNYIDASFEIAGQYLEVKKCGFRVVYKQDVEETTQRKFQFIHPPTEDLGLEFFSFDYT